MNVLQKYWWLILIIIILIIAASVIKAMAEENSDPGADDPGATDPGTGNYTWGIGHDNFPLRKGSHGNRVGMLQQALNRYIDSYSIGFPCLHGRKPIDVDNKFGEITEDALHCIWNTKEVSQNLYDQMI